MLLPPKPEPLIKFCYQDCCRTQELCASRVTAALCLSVLETHSLSRNCTWPSKDRGTRVLFFSHFPKPVPSIGKNYWKIHFQASKRAEKHRNRVATTTTKWWVYKISRRMDGQYKSYGLRDSGQVPNHPPKCFAKMMQQLTLFLEVYEGVFTLFPVLDTINFFIFVNLLMKIDIKALLSICIPIVRRTVHWFWLFLQKELSAF